jgi:23S rRNA (uracil1939-C5)-methyltransferase
MAKDEYFTGHIEGIAAGGEGFLRLEGRIVFIRLAAPGDLLRFRITEEHRAWARGEILDILEEGRGRVSPRCPCYGRCGGCSLQHLSSQAQVEAKKAILEDALRHTGGITGFPGIGLHPSAPWEYRNRVRLHRVPGTPHPAGRGAGGEAPLGFRERRGSRVIPLRDCPVADRGIRDFLAAPPEDLPPEGQFTLYAREGSLLREGGRSRGKIRVLDRELWADAGLFFQSNGVMLEALIGELLRIAGEAGRSLPLGDLYCGVGTFAAFLGPLFPGTVLVEENRRALSLARENLRGREGRFFALSGEEWVEGPEEGPLGFVVLDPPREGLSPPVRRWLARRGPALAAYVSCDAATLARDSGELIAGGYRIKELHLFDFYPQTAHIETLAVFARDV